MQIVIDISAEDFEKVKYGRGAVSMMRKAIQRGIPLPKHGRLIDADELDVGEVFDHHGNRQGYRYVGEYELNNAPTIIEADKAYEVEVITRGNCMICGKELDEGLFFCKECEAKAESESILDKIRAEIEEWYWQTDKQALTKDPCIVDTMVDLFIRMIDKYQVQGR